jgi:hypothetical protein
MVFAREITPGLTSLVKKVDEATAQNKSADLCSFVVLCSDDKDLEEKAKKLAEQEKIEKTVLTIDNQAGPKPMKLSKDADVTVVLYVKKKAAANHAFKKGELNASAIEKVLGDLPKIVK